MAATSNSLISAERSVQGRERIVWVDTYRAIMIFAIAWVHALGMKSTSNGAIARYLQSFNVPAFFFVSGYLFSTGNGNFWEFFKSKVLRFLVPYYVFGLFSIFVFVLLGQFASAGLDVAVKSTEVLPNILGMFYGSGTTGYMKWNLPLWFIPCLFATQILFYFPIKYLNQTKKKNMVMTVMLAVSLVVAFVNYYVLHISKLPMGLETAFYLLPFMLIGYWLRSVDAFGNLGRSIKLLVGIACVFIGFILGVFAQTRVNYPSSTYSNLGLFYISAVTTSVGFALLSHFVAAKWLSYWGRKTLPILLMHKFPIVFAQMLLPAFMQNNVLLAVISAVVIAVVSCLASLFAGQIIENICPQILGEKRKFKGIA